MSLAWWHGADPKNSVSLRAITVINSARSASLHDWSAEATETLLSGWSRSGRNSDKQTWNFTLGSITHNIWNHTAIAICPNTYLGWILQHWPIITYSQWNECNKTKHRSLQHDTDPSKTLLDVAMWGHMLIYTFAILPCKYLHIYMLWKMKRFLKTLSKSENEAKLSIKG